MDDDSEGLPKIPDLRIAQLKFMLMERGGGIAAWEAIVANIMDKDMAPFYEELCKEVSTKPLNIQFDRNLFDEMKKRNEEKVVELDGEIENAKKDAGEVETRSAIQRKAEYLCLIGDKDAALTEFRKTLELKPTVGQKLDIIFFYLRIGLFYLDNDLLSRNIEKAKSFIDEGGDWDRRNRLKVYQSLHCITIRDFTTAANLLLDSVATFTSYELMDYQTCIKYTVLTSVLSLDRQQLKDKVVFEGSILEVLHKLPSVRQLLFSLYNCKYHEFFQALGTIEQELKDDRYWSSHRGYYVREMRILAYKQLLQSYRSLSLDKMAAAFGVTTQFIDRELSRFIAAGRLHCKIDLVNNLVETNRPDNKNSQYQAAIKQGDLLLNRVQKLSRVVNI